MMRCIHEVRAKNKQNVFSNEWECLMCDMANESTWDSVPYELLLEIFSYLKADDLMCSIQHVCSRWMEACRDAWLWKTLKYSPSQEVCSEDVRQFLEQAPLLRHFSLGAHSEADKIVEMLPDYCQNIETLVLHCSRHSCSSQGLLARLLFCLENIKCLEISLVKISEELVVSFPKNLKALTLNFRTFDTSVYRLITHVIHSSNFLQELQIYFQQPVYNSDLKTLVQEVSKVLTHFAYVPDNFAGASNIFSQCTNLKSLVFNRPWLHPGTFNLKYIGRLPQLQNLTISCMSIVSDSLSKLFLMNSWIQLIKLDFAGLKGFDNSLLGDVFKACPNLQELNACDSSISDEGFKQACHYGSRLKRVYLNRTSLTDAGLQKLHQCSCLLALSIEDCDHLTGNAAHNVGQCAQLTDLNVSNNAWVTDRTVETLLQCQRLKYLNMEFCPYIIATCFLSVAVPRNLCKVRITCANKNELTELMAVAEKKNFLCISHWCFSIPSYTD